MPPTQTYEYDSFSKYIAANRLAHLGGGAERCPVMNGTELAVDKSYF